MTLGFRNARNVIPTPEKSTLRRAINAVVQTTSLSFKSLIRELPQMIHAYAKNYLPHARNNFGRMLDSAVNMFHYPLGQFYGLFLDSSLSSRFSSGAPDALVGHSGIELACEVIQEHNRSIPPDDWFPKDDHSPEYWTGWALATYQWRLGWSFQEINSFAGIDKICSLYHPYHEMDIQKFVELLDEWYRIAHPSSRLKKRRMEAHLTQSQLASLSGVPLRTIQQYEQRQKKLDAARADSLLSMAQALHCTPQELLEPI